MAKKRSRGHPTHKPWLHHIFSAVLQICFANYTMLTGHLSKNGFLSFYLSCCCSIIQHMLYNIWFNLVLCGFLLLISCYRVQSKLYFSQSWFEPFFHRSNEWLKCAICTFVEWTIPRRGHQWVNRSFIRSS